MREIERLSVAGGSGIPTGTLSILEVTSFFVALRCWSTASRTARDFGH